MNQTFTIALIYTYNIQLNWLCINSVIVITIILSTFKMPFFYYRNSSAYISVISVMINVIDINLLYLNCPHKIYIMAI